MKTKKPKLPEIDLKELEKEMESNRQQRREFVRLYAQWLKKTPNKVWTKGQNRLLSRAKAQA